MLTDDVKDAVRKMRDAVSLGQGDVVTAANKLIESVNLLLAAHSAGAQEPVGELVIGECKNGYSAPWLFRLFDGVQAKDGMQLYAQPQPLADAARDALINRARSALKGMVKWFGPYPEFIPDWPAQADAVKAAIGHAKVVLAEIERIEREESGK